MWFATSQDKVTVASASMQMILMSMLKHSLLLRQVLSDPRQKRFFKSKDMRDLFTLGDQYQDAPETAAIFAGLDLEVALDPAQLARPSSADPTAAAVNGVVQDGAGAEQNGAGSASDAGPSSSGAWWKSCRCCV